MTVHVTENVHPVRLRLVVSKPLLSQAVLGGLGRPIAGLALDAPPASRPWFGLLTLLAKQRVGVARCLRCDHLLKTPLTPALVVTPLPFYALSVTLSRGPAPLLSYWAVGDGPLLAGVDGCARISYSRAPTCILSSNAVTQHPIAGGR